MAGHLRHQHRWIFCVVALAVWLALGWPFLGELTTATVRRDSPVPALWLLPFTLFGAAVLGATLLKLRTSLQWSLLCVQLAAVVAMTIMHRSDVVSLFLIVIAWQIAMATTPVNALSWIAFQTLAIIGTLAQFPNPDLSYIIALSFVLQLCSVFAAHALRREAETARALTQTNRELRSAQAIIANTARDSERLHISRELHDAWGHELTALSLQLEIASKVGEPARAADHVAQAKGLSRALLGKVRDVVATLREAERGDEGVRHMTRDGSAGPGSDFGAASPQTDRLRKQHQWIFGVGALAVSLALGWPVLQALMTGTPMRGVPVSLLWLVSFAVFGAAALAAIVLKLRPSIRWALLGVQVAAVAAMAFIASWAMMSAFLIIVAWQVASATGPVNALRWVAFQTLAVIGTLALAPNPDLCWVIGKSFALQLFFVFAAQALRRQAQTAQALAETNRELRSAQAIIAHTARDAERLRISRELHDAWGHELTALGLQLEIASHVTEPARTNDHVMQAKELARGLLANVRDVVATLRETERRDLKDSLVALVHSVPRPAIHVAISPGVRVNPDQTHALMRCAQEAVTNAVKHAEASNLWLQVTSDGEGVRLVARDDGSARRLVPSPGSGLLGMRERVESLGGKLAVQAGAGLGFTVDAWLPSSAPQAT
jgi:signal transduction histidine kinase